MTVNHTLKQSPTKPKVACAGQLQGGSLKQLELNKIQAKIGGDLFPAKHDQLHGTGVGEQFSLIRP